MWVNKQVYALLLSSFYSDKTDKKWVTLLVLDEYLTEKVTDR